MEALWSKRGTTREEGVETVFLGRSSAGRSHHLVQLAAMAAAKSGSAIRN